MFAAARAWPRWLRSALAVGVVACAGCTSAGGVGSLASEGLGGRPARLDLDCTTLVYGHDDRGETSFLLTDIPVDDLLKGRVRDGQVLHVQLLWTPKAGATPMDPTATNVSVRHVIMTDGEVGLYGGAGFALPSHAPGRSVLSLQLRDTSVRLLDATDGFRDPLSPARIRGGFTATLDDRLTQRLQRAASQLVTNALGHRTYVDAASPPPPPVTPGRSRQVARSRAVAGS
ncbi:MAG: hypothetical protein HKO59_13875 [Phycisphaerales bacterium]|nr:hypothetical protein [Phycisphaerae bacterium]NNF42710.1 hypothetical protein [Phycisphaerales bacterium]NNM27049.1 hypothetical protein [Phycisphaerales bacterium]